MDLCCFAHTCRCWPVVSCKKASLYRAISRLTFADRARNRFTFDSAVQEAENRPAAIRIPVRSLPFRMTIHGPTTLLRAERISSLTYQSPSLQGYRRVFRELLTTVGHDTRYEMRSHATARAFVPVSPVTALYPSKSTCPLYALPAKCITPLSIVTKTKPLRTASPSKYASVTCLVPYRRGKKGLHSVCQSAVIGR